MDSIHNAEHHFNHYPVFFFLKEHFSYHDSCCRLVVPPGLPDRVVDEGGEEEEEAWNGFGGSTQDNKNTSVAVSYTHLDVYKRQELKFIKILN